MDGLEAVEPMERVSLETELLTRDILAVMFVIDACVFSLASSAVCFVTKRSRDQVFVVRRSRSDRGQEAGYEGAVESMYREDMGGIAEGEDEGAGRSFEERRWIEVWGR